MDTPDQEFDLVTRSQEQLSRQLVRDHRSKMPWSHHAFAWHVRFNLTPSLFGSMQTRPHQGKSEKQLSKPVRVINTPHARN